MKMRKHRVMRVWQMYDLLSARAEEISPWDDWFHGTLYMEDTQ